MVYTPARSHSSRTSAAGGRSNAPSQVNPRQRTSSPRSYPYNQYYGGKRAGTKVPSDWKTRTEYSPPATGYVTVGGRFRSEESSSLRLTVPRSTAAVQASVASAVSNAWPPGAVAAAVGAGAAIAEAVRGGVEAINDAVEQANEWLIGETAPASQNVHPGLNYIGILKGPEWMVGPGPFQAPQSKPFVWNGVGGLGVTYLSSGTDPKNYNSYGWGTATVAATAVNNLQYLGLFTEPMTWRYKSTQRRYQRQIHVYRNVSGATIPNWLVEAEAQFGALQRKAASRSRTIKARSRIQARPPRRVSEVYIDIMPPRVVVSLRPAQKPPSGRKEHKGSGKAWAASAAFWAFEMADDIADWIDIVVSAHTTMPHDIRRASRARQVAWLAANPETLITDVRWDIVGIAMVGWFIDEKIGQWAGRAQRSAHRAFGSGPSQSKYGLAGNSGAGVGSEVAAFVQSFM